HNIWGHTIPNYYFVILIWKCIVREQAEQGLHKESKSNLLNVELDISASTQYPDSDVFVCHLITFSQDHMHAHNICKIMHKSMFESLNVELDISASTQYPDSDVCLKGIEGLNCFTSMFEREYTTFSFHYTT
ncbi:hypothetical protein ACJX0J_026216, partial [Zea mays]